MSVRDRGPSPTTVARPAPSRSATRAARLLLVALSCVAVLTASGCQSVALTRAGAGTPPAQAQSSAQPSAQASAAPIASPPTYPKPIVALTGLEDGLQRWDRPITVRVHNGSLLSLRAVDVTTGGSLGGSRSRTGWVAAKTEVPNRTYRIVADVRGLAGTRTHVTRTVRTSAPTSTVDTDVTPFGGATVGVGSAVIVTFSRHVTDRAAATAALRVTTSRPVTGAWRWFSATEVHWRPKAYWPAHTQVTVHDDLLGVQVAPGVWGLRNRDVHFSIGDSHVTTVDVASQTMTVTSNGAVVGTYPVSTGRAAYPTKGGVHVVLSKVPSIIMDSRTVGIPKSSRDFYYETVLWDVRISDGGAFVHYAPWSVRSQGHRPVSHGCVNVNLTAATTFYALSVVGDIVNVVNDPEPPNRADPGMADWNYTWDQFTSHRNAA